MDTTTNPYSTEELAEAGYKAYGAEAEWKTWDGKAMPPWEAVGAVVQARWKAAAREIVFLVSLAGCLCLVLANSGCAVLRQPPQPSPTACMEWSAAEQVAQRVCAATEQQFAAARAAACVPPAPPATP